MDDRRAAAGGGLPALQRMAEPMAGAVVSDLHDRRVSRDPVLVVGGTRGTGLVVAQLLAGEGRGVRVLARDPDRARGRLASPVHITPGDITKPGTLARAVEGVRHVVFTAGVHSGRPATETRIRTTEFDGVRNTLVAAQRAGFRGRFLYMTASGVTSRSFARFALNTYKGNTLVWRGRAEDEIRASGLDYTIVRAAVLVNGTAGRHSIVVRRDSPPLSFFQRIARADVAQGLVAAMDHPRASRATLDVAWGKGPLVDAWPALLDRLTPDVVSSEVHP